MATTMSEEAASSNNSNEVENEAKPSSNTCDGVNDPNSPVNHEVLADATVVAVTVENHTDAPTSSQNNHDHLCFNGEALPKKIGELRSQEPPNTGYLHQSGDQNGSKEEASSDYYVVSNENTVEPPPTSDTIESVGNLDAYRDGIIGDDTDSTDSESSSTVSEDDDADSDNNSSEPEPSPQERKAKKGGKTLEELALQALPPLEDLGLAVDESKCREIGTIETIVDKQVVIQSFPNSPPLDLDTVLFLDRGKRPLGKIFDVLGNIQEPFYAVRFNSKDDIKERNIAKHQTVYFVPESDYTSYVDTTELMKMKGSDASWRNNIEAPVSLLDFSDDDDEARAKRPMTTPGSKRECSTADNDVFVKKMNQRNLELTAKRKKEDEAKQKRAPLTRRMISNAKNSMDASSNASSLAYPHYGGDGYKPKSRSYANVAEQAGSGGGSRGVNFHHHAGNKFDPITRFLVGGYNSPSNYPFPPQHLFCSSPRQLPNVVPNAQTQNYLTMFSRPSMQTTNAMQPPPPPPPPFSSYTGVPPTFAAQPAMHPLQQSLRGPIPPPQFSNFAPLSAPPLPSSIPQTYFTCADTSSMPQPAFIPMNVRPGLSTAAFHQFVLPPPPPPTNLSIQHHPHGRDVALPRPDRRNAQSSHSNPTYYPHSPYNS